MAIFHKGLQYHEDKIEKHKITAEEIEFLKKFQQELNTQDNVGQANPRYWVIRGTEKIYNVIDFEEVELYYKGNKEAGSIDEIEKYLSNPINTHFCALEVSIDNFSNSAYITYKKYEDDDEEYEFYSFDEFKQWLLNEFGFELVTYKTIEKTYDNTMFLTQIDAEEHLQNNAYHYSEDAHTYAMTAWRNPRMEKLLKILQEVDWGNTN